MNNGGVRNAITAGATIIGVLFVVGFVVKCASSGLVPQYSTGERTGTVTKFSTKGVIFKSKEGQLMLVGGVGVESGNVWDFSCVDTDVSSQLETMLGQSVVVTYEQWLFQPVWVDTSYRVTSVRLAQD